MQLGWEGEELRGSLGNYWRAREGIRNLIIDLEVGWGQSFKREVRKAFSFYLYIKNFS